MSARGGHAGADAVRRSAGILVYRARPELAVLLVRETRGAGRGTWGIPKGGVEPGEDAERAARRETREETSVVVRGRLDDLGVVEHAYPGGRGRTRVFAAVAPAGAAPLPTLPEVDRAEFIELGAAWRLMHPEQRMILDRLLVLLAD